MRQISGPAREELFAQQSDNAVIHFLDIEFTDNEGGTDILYFCDQHLPVESGGTLYQPAAFQINLGEDIEENVPTVNLTFDSGDRQVVRWLRENNTAPNVTLNIGFSKNPDVFEMGPFDFSVESFNITASVITLKLTLEPILNEPLPAAKYTPTLFPQLWGSIV